MCYLQREDYYVVAIHLCVCGFYNVFWLRSHKKRENWLLTAIYYISFGTEFQKSNSVIVCHKKSEDRGASLGKMDI